MTNFKPGGAKLGIGGLSKSVVLYTTTVTEIAGRSLVDHVADIPANGASITGTPLDSDAAYDGLAGDVGYYANYDSRASQTVRVTMNDPLPQTELGAMRDGDFVHVIYGDETNYDVAEYRGIVSGRRTVVTSGLESPGVFKTNYTDLHGHTVHVIGDVGDANSERAVSGIIALGSQVGGGVATNEFQAENPSYARLQARSLFGAMGITSAGKAAIPNTDYSAATHWSAPFCGGHGGYTGGAGLRMFSYAYAGQPGHVHRGIDLRELISSTAAISFGRRTNNNAETLLEYDTNDYTFYNRTADRYDWVIGGSTAAYITALGYGGSGSYLDVTAEGATTPRSLADRAADVANVKDHIISSTVLGGAGAVYVPDGVHTTTLGPTAIVARLYGSGQVQTSDGNRRGRSHSHVSSAPSVTHSWDSALTAFNNDLSKVHSVIEHRITGADTLGQPTTGYAMVRGASANYTFFINSSGHNQGTADNEGRTGVAANFVTLNNNGQGDAFAYYATAIASGVKTGATNFLANSAAVLFAGTTLGGANGVYLNPREINLEDMGFAVAAIGDVVNLKRTNATATLGQYWAGYRVQNKGTVAYDDAFISIGKAKRGLTLVYNDFETDQAAVVLKSGQRIYGNAVGSSPTNMNGIALGSQYVTFDGVNWKVAGAPLDATVTAANSTTPRSLQSRFAEEVNVLDHYGPSGTYTDTQALQAAIAALPAAGGVLVLPANRTLTVTAPIVVDKDNVAVRGAHRGNQYGPVIGGTIISPSADFIGDFVLKFTRSAAWTNPSYPGVRRALGYCSLENVVIDGQARGTNIGGVLWEVFLGNMTNVAVVRMTGDGVLGRSIPGTGTTYPYAAYDNKFSRCRFGMNTGSGFVGTDYFSDNHFTDITCDYNGARGIDFDATSTSNLMTRPYVYNNTGVAIIMPAWESSVLGGRLQDNNGGIRVIGNGGGFEIIGTKIRDCSFTTDNTSDGIEISPTGETIGGIISDVSFITDPGNGGTPGAKRVRYGINITTSLMQDLVIGTIAKGYKSPAVGAIGTALIRDLGTRTKRSHGPSTSSQTTGQGLVSQNFDRQAAANQSIMIGGTAYVMMVSLKDGDTIGNVYVQGATAGSGTTLFKAGIYSADGATLYASSASQHTQFDSSGGAVKTIPLSASWTAPADGIYAVVIVATATTTMPTLQRGFTHAGVMRIGSAAPPYAVAGTALTDLPAAPVTFANSPGAPISFWVGVGA